MIEPAAAVNEGAEDVSAFKEDDAFFGNHPDARRRPGAKGPKAVAYEEGDGCYCEEDARRRPGAKGPKAVAYEEGDGCYCEEDARRRPGAKGPKAEDVCVDANGAVLGEPTCEPPADSTLPAPVAP